MRKGQGLAIGITLFILVIAISAFIFYINLIKEQLVHVCAGVSLEYLQECCDNWASENNIVHIQCIGEWEIKDNQCSWKCTEEKEKMVFICKSDNDCLKVDASCCGCGADGSAIAINKSYNEYWNNKLINECRDHVCATVMSLHISCFSEPECVDNKCKLVLSNDSICNSWGHDMCKYISEEDLDRVNMTDGISCREVIEMCKE